MLSISITMPVIATLSNLIVVCCAKEDDSSAEDESRELGWSAYGMDAYCKDNWKVLRLPEPYGNGDWQLYDLAADPGELHNLADKFPGRAAALAQAWADYADRNGVIQPDSATAYAKPIVGRKY